MVVLNRRAFMAVTAAGVVAPTVIAPQETESSRSLEARTLAVNNVAPVGPEVARKKTAGWAAASKALRAPRPKHLDLAYAQADRTKWDLYPATDPQAPCYVHIHGGYWQRGRKESFACRAEGVLARGWSAALPGYTLAPDAGLTQITKERRTARDWFAAQAGAHGMAGPVIRAGWSAGGHLTACLVDHPRVAAGVAMSGVFELAPLRDSPHVNDKVKLTEVEIEPLSPMRVPGVNKPLSIAYGTGEWPALIASSREFHAYRAQAHLPGGLIPVVKTNHVTILDELRLPTSSLTRAVLQLAGM
jgi:arylformamidase